MKGHDWEDCLAFEQCKRCDHLRMNELQQKVGEAILKDYEEKNRV